MSYTQILEFLKSQNLNTLISSLEIEPKLSPLSEENKEYLMKDFPEVFSVIFLQDIKQPHIWQDDKGYCYWWAAFLGDSKNECIIRSKKDIIYNSAHKGVYISKNNLTGIFKTYNTCAQSKISFLCFTVDAA
ncbi:MAG: hypothetical protein J0H29_13330 [Sphingobacteriales bacterium]|nr:hypothetical protein [Sphingobacteriales bacterium]OJY86360.1 MAG: hypothetical protein BGP14_20510 [Sphingobacteriales bacterium 44-15]